MTTIGTRTGSSLARRLQGSAGLIRHSDRGSQYVSIRYTERLAEAGVEPSVGSVGDSYDNTLAKTINGLYKAELIHRRAPWKSREAVELATLEWVHWFNNHRLLEPIGYGLVTWERIRSLRRPVPAAGERGHRAGDPVRQPGIRPVTRAQGNKKAGKPPTAILVRRRSRRPFPWPGAPHRGSPGFFLSPL